jgi:hypothetical protein
MAFDGVRRGARSGRREESRDRATQAACTAGAGRRTAGSGCSRREAGQGGPGAGWDSSTRACWRPSSQYRARQRSSGGEGGPQKTDGGCAPSARAPGPANHRAQVGGCTWARAASSRDLGPSAATSGPRGSWAWCVRTATAASRGAGGGGGAHWARTRCNWGLCIPRAWRAPG